ncbi:MAG TPA: hypothetical protein VFF25_02265, partial [Clostridia bacterium]|nr:hypothetical protein [Clostridia bacterium]
MGLLKIIFNISVMGPLKIILNMSVTGSTMFLIFLLMKPLTKKNFGSSWHYYALIMILMFFAIPIGKFINIPNFFPMAKIQQLTDQNNVSENIDLENIREVQNANDFRDTEKQTNKQMVGKETEYDPVQPEEHGISGTNSTNSTNRKTFNAGVFKDIIPYIWIIGMIILLLLKIIPYIKFKT